MTEEYSCPACGLVAPDACGSAEDMEACPHHRIQTGPMTGVRINRYKVIYADPPWSFKTYSAPVEGTVPHRGEIEPYKTMTAEDLLDLPVSNVAADDCVLHMWVISSHIEQAIILGAAWGFTYKSLGMVWVKTQKSDPEKPKMGMGHWFRQEAEVCLLFTRGKPKRLSAGVRQVILEPAREHSRKPDEAMTRVESLSAGPYLEMFSRSSRPGWDAMGDQQGKFDTVDLKEMAEIEDLI